MTTRNNSSIDLTSSAAMQRIPTIPNIRKPKPTSTGRPEYRGICIPVDIAMMFQVRNDIKPSNRVQSCYVWVFFRTQVNEGEDVRSVSTLKQRIDIRRRSKTLTFQKPPYFQSVPVVILFY